LLDDHFDFELVKVVSRAAREIDAHDVVPETPMLAHPRRDSDRLTHISVAIREVQDIDAALSKPVTRFGRESAGLTNVVAGEIELCHIASLSDRAPLGNGSPSGNRRHRG
jgi:hypothetical protein